MVREELTIVAAPTAFKETLSPLEAARVISRALRPHRVIPIPVADGGDGTLESLRAAWGGRIVRRRVTGPLGSLVEARYLVAGPGAVIEMAEASGLKLVPKGRRDPMRATTRGTGELIAAALDGGARRVYVGVGGSATVDGGQGALEALGARRLHRVTVLCDVATKFLDAPRIFGPQKGATPRQIPILRARLAALPYARRVHRLPGSGAAGGLAGGLASRGARLLPGAAFVLRAVRLRERARGADLVVTGEGRVDATTRAGKAVGGVLRISPAPVAIVCGTCAIDPGVPVVELASVDPDPLGHPARALAKAARALIAQVSAPARR